MRSYDSVSLRSKIDAARQEFPEQKLGSDDQLRARMGRFLPGGEPGKAHFSEVVNGRRRISSAFLASIHRAFAFDRLDLPTAIWFAEDLEQGFVTPLRAARRKYLNPLEWLHQAAEAPAADGFRIRVQGGLLGIGFDRNYENDRYLSLTLGQSVRLELLLPRDGWLTLFNVYPAPDLKGPMIHWIDPPLRNVMKRRSTGLVMLPEEGEGIPVGRPTGLNSLFALLWPEKPTFGWPQSVSQAVEIDVEDLRSAFLRFGAVADGGSGTGVDVALLSYNVIDPAG